MRSFVRDCYSFCRFAVLAAPGPGEAAAAAGSQPEPAASLEQQREQQAAEDFAAAVLADTEPAGDAPAAETAGSGDAAGTAREGGEPEHLAADAAADASGSQPCPIAAAIWALHPCERASPEAPPALLAIPGGSERAAEVVCCACGATLAEFREEAAGRKLGMLMAVQLYCAPAAAAAGAGAGAAAAAAAGDSAAAAADGAHASLRVCLAAGYEDGSLVLWDAAAPAAPRAARRLCTEPVMALALDASVAPAGGAAGSAEDSVVVFKLDHGTPPKISIRHAIELKRQGIADLAVRPDGKLLVTAGWDGRVRAYKYRSGRPLAILKVRRGVGWLGRGRGLLQAGLQLLQAPMQQLSCCFD